MSNTTFTNNILPFSATDIDITSDPAGTITLTGGNVTLTAGDSEAITITGGNSTSTTGGDVTLQAGSGNAANAGGDTTIQAGQGGATGIGGTTIIQGGSGGATSGDGGSVSIQGGIPTDGDGGPINIQAADAVGTNNTGGALTMQTGDGTGTGNGGTMTLTAGDGSSGGPITITAGQALTSGNTGGATTVQSGTAAVSATNGNGGILSLFSADGRGTGNGGNILVTAGDAGATSGNGGDVVIRSGNFAGGGVDGDIQLIAAGSGDITLATSGDIFLTAGTTNDVSFAANAGSILLNTTASPDLDSSFFSSTIITAFNELSQGTATFYVSSASQFTTALAAIPSSGGKIKMAPGTYQFSSQQNLPANLLIEGSGINNTIIQAGAASITVFNATNNSNITITNMSFDTNALETTMVTFDSTNTTTSNFIVANCSFFGTTGGTTTSTGIQLTASSTNSLSNILIYSCIFNDLARHIIADTAGTITHLIVSKCTFINANTQSVLIDADADSVYTVSDNIFNSCSLAVKVGIGSTSTGRGLITGNVMQNNSANFDILSGNDNIRVINNNSEDSYTIQLGISPYDSRAILNNALTYTLPDVPLQCVNHKIYIEANNTLTVTYNSGAGSLDMTSGDSAIFEWIGTDWILHSGIGIAVPGRCVVMNFNLSSTYSNLFTNTSISTVTPQTPTLNASPTINSGGYTALFSFVEGTVPGTGWSFTCNVGGTYRLEWHILHLITTGGNASFTTNVFSGATVGTASDTGWRCQGTRLAGSAENGDNLTLQFAGVITAGTVFQFRQLSNTSGERIEIRTLDFMACVI